MTKKELNLLFGGQSLIWHSVLFVPLDSLKKRPSDDLATVCYILLKCVMWYFRLRLVTMLLNQTKDMRMWHRCSADRQMSSSGVVWGILWVTAEGWKWEWGRMSQTSVFRMRSALFWSRSLTIATCAQCDLSRRRVDLHRQCWRLLFLFYFSFILAFSAKNSNWYYSVS